MENMVKYGKMMLNVPGLYHYKIEKKNKTINTIQQW